MHYINLHFTCLLTCFDAVGWVTERAPSLYSVQVVPQQFPEKGITLTETECVSMRSLTTQCWSSPECICVEESSLYAIMFCMLIVEIIIVYFTP